MRPRGPALASALLFAGLGMGCAARHPSVSEARPPQLPCGSARPALDAIKTAEGLVIAPDGTIYFSQPFAGQSPSFLGRYRPPYTEPEIQWLDIGGNALGITLDPKRNVLYAGSRTLKKVLKITLTEPPRVEALADAEGGINGVTLGADGAVYYTDQTGGHVYRVQDGRKEQVTLQPLTQPNGLAFGPDGDLYVVSWTTPEVTRLKLAGGHETSRNLHATLPVGRGDGIAFDLTGRAYVTANKILHRISADGKTVDALGPTNGANIDFGVGALSCGDMYIAGNGQGITRYESDTTGMNVPWHRQ